MGPFYSGQLRGAKNISLYAGIPYYCLIQSWVDDRAVGSFYDTVANEGLMGMWTDVQVGLFTQTLLALCTR